MGKNIKECPVCGNSELVVQKIKCQECDTSVEGSFDFVASNEFSSLNSELSHFLKVFIFTEGNIKQTERLMNCSYPKVKNLLRKLRSALSLDSEELTEVADDNEVLQRVESGELSVSEAMKLLK